MAGYSGTPLPQKLGIRSGARLRFVAAPEGFAGALGALPTGVRFASRGPADVVVFFTDRRAELGRRFARLARGLDRAGGLWIAWPKKSSGVFDRPRRERRARDRSVLGAGRQRGVRNRRDLVGPSLRGARRRPEMIG